MLRKTGWLRKRKMLKKRSQRELRCITYTLELVFLSFQRPQLQLPAQFMLSVRTNPSTLAAGLGALKNEFRKLTDQSVKMSHPMYRESQTLLVFVTWKHGCLKNVFNSQFLVDSVIMLCALSNLANTCSKNCNTFDVGTSHIQFI